MTLIDLVLICRACRERYTPLQLCAGEPCPRVNCDGELVEADQ